MLHVYNIIGSSWWQQQVATGFCKVARGACSTILALVSDADPEVDNMDQLPTFLQDYPAGSSVYELILFMQNVVTEGF
jgi:hypothetical protein